MATQYFSSVIPFVSASITTIDEKFLHLSSPSLGTGEIIQVSAAIARNAFPRLSSNTTPRLADEFRIGDEFNLDVSRDVNYFIPVRIHWIKLQRPEGVRFIGDGMVIDVSDPIGPVIRSTYIPDFVCPKDRAIPGTTVAIRNVVTFEALIKTTANIEGLSFRINQIESFPFPVYTANGIVQKMPSSDEVKLRCRLEDGQTMLFPLYHRAYFGCGVPVYALVGETVACTICPKQPHLNSTDLQVIFFEPTGKGAVPRMHRLPSAALDGARSLGSGVTSRKSYHEVQCSSYFNEDTMKLLRDSFLFTMAHSDESSFDKLIRTHPKLVSVVLNEMGIGDGEIYGDEGAVSNEDDSGIHQGSHHNTSHGDGLEAAASPMRPIPVAPNFLPPDSLMRSPVPSLKGSDADFGKAQDDRGVGGRRVPVPPNFHPSEVFGPDFGLSEQTDRTGVHAASIHGSASIATREQAIPELPKHAAPPARRSVDEYISTARRTQISDDGNGGHVASFYGSTNIATQEPTITAKLPVQAAPPARQPVEEIITGARCMQISDVGTGTPGGNGTFGGTGTIGGAGRGVSQNRTTHLGKVKPG